MRLCIFGCLGGLTDNERSTTLQQHHKVQQNDETIGKASQDSVQALNEIQAILVGLDGTWLSRLVGLVRAFESQGLVARLYGLSEPSERALLEFILMPGSVRTGALVHDEAEMLAQMHDTQAPVSRLISVHANDCLQKQSTLTAPLRRAVAVLPILQSGKLVGALWLAAPHSPPHPTPLPPPPPTPNAYPGFLSRSRSIDDDDHSDDTAMHAAHTSCGNTGGTATTAAAAFSLLLSSSDLKQLSLAASMCLADSAPLSLPWLASALCRLQSAPTTLSLTGHLAAAVTAHVRARFVLEAQPTTVLVPPGRETSVALLFRIHPPLPHTGVAAAPSALYVVGSSGLVSGSRAAQRPLVPAGPMSCPVDTPPHPCPHTPLLATSACQSTARSNGSSWHRVLVPLNLPETASTASVATATNSTATIAAAAAAASTGAVLPTAAALYASAFPLTNTLLQAVLNGQRGQQPVDGRRQHPYDPSRLRHGSGGVSDGAAAAASAILNDRHGGGGGGVASPTPTAAATLGVVEDIMRFVQNVHNPSRDIYMLCGLRWGSMTGGAVGVGCGSSGGSGSGSMGVPIAPKSLVLLTLGLGDGGWLGLYLTFGRRLPGPLLEAVQGSCQELLDKALSHPVREQLRGPLAVEYDTLKAAAPGSYAVVRAHSTNGDVSAASGSGMMPPGGAGAGGGIGSASAGGGSLLATGDLGEVSDAAVLSVQHPQSSVQQAQLQSAAGGGGTGSGRQSMEAVKVAYPSRRGSSTAIDATASSFHYQQPRQAATQPAADDTTDALISGFNTMAVAGVNGALHVAGFTSGGGSSQGHLDDPNTSIIMVQGPECGTVTVRQRMDLLVESIHATINTAVAAVGATAFPGDLDQLQLLEVLGRGSGGVVFRGLMSGSLPVAVKLMEVPDEDLRTSEAASGSPGAAMLVVRVRQEVLRNATELAVQSSLSHPNIVQFYSTFTNVALRSVKDKGSPGDGATASGVDSGGAEGNGQGRSLLDRDPKRLCLRGGPTPTVAADEAPFEELRVTCIVSEFCDGGCLGTALYRKNFPKYVQQTATGGGEGDAVAQLTWDMKGIYMTLLDVALALRHLHSMHLVHRDVKPANLLLKSNHRDYRGFTVKLADFGFVMHLTEEAEDGSRYTYAEQACGTVTHMAPECMAPKCKIGTSADIFSFGILMWELLAGGVRPYPTVRPDKIPGLVYRGARPSFSPQAPLTYQALAHACWSTQPTQRPRATDLVALITSLIQSM